MKIFKLNNISIADAALAIIFLSVVLGINHQLVGRILLGILLFTIFIQRKNIHGLNGSFNSISNSIMSLAPVLFAASTVITLISNVYSGRHGVDFVIFSQAIENIARLGKPMTTMVGIEPVNFLSHHFFPAIYVIGIAGFVGIPGWLAGILFTFFSLAVTLYSLFKICLLFKLERGKSFAILVIFCLHPTIRQGFSFSIHDEIFALGILAASLRYYCEKRYVRAVVLTTLLLLFKETFFLYVFIFSILTATQLYSLNNREWRYFAILTACTTATFILYCTIWRSFFGVSFNATDRIQGLADFFDYNSLSSKARLLINVLLPTLGLALFSSNGRRFVVFGMPFWGACLISNFPEMWKPSNYYMVIPVTLLHIGAIATLAEKGSLQEKFSTLIITLLILIDTSIGYKYRPLSDLRAAIAAPVASPNSLAFIKPNERVVVSEFDALFLHTTAIPIRLWTANRLEPKFDSLLIRKKSQDEPFAQPLIALTTVCYEDPTWIKRCRF